MNISCKLHCVTEEYSSVHAHIQAELQHVVLSISSTISGTFFVQIPPPLHGKLLFRVARHVGGGSEVNLEVLPVLALRQPLDARMKKPLFNQVSYDQHQEMLHDFQAAAFLGLPPGRVQQHQVGY